MTKSNSIYSFYDITKVTKTTQCLSLEYLHQIYIVSLTDFSLYNLLYDALPETRCHNTRRQ